MLLRFDVIQKLMKEFDEKHYKRYGTEKKFFYHKIKYSHCGWKYWTKEQQSGYKETNS